MIDLTPSGLIAPCPFINLLMIWPNGAILPEANMTCVMGTYLTEKQNH